MEKEQDRNHEKTIESFRRQGGGEVVVIDTWNPGIDENKVPEEELLPGEIEAATFQIGGYTVRSALRVYTIQDPDWYPAEIGKPAKKKDVEIVRKDLISGKGDEKISGARGNILAVWGNIDTCVSHLPAWRDKLRITHEISARYNSNPDKSFTCICRAADPMNGKCFEYIGDIYVVKERATDLDKSASLLIYFVFTSDFYGVDTWYKFEPDGEITTFVSDLLNLDR